MYTLFGYVPDLSQVACCLSSFVLADGSPFANVVQVAPLFVVDAKPIPPGYNKVHQNAFPLVLKNATGSP